DGQLSYGVLLGSRIVQSGGRVDSRDMPLLGMEAEIGFRFLPDAPPRAAAYSYDDVADSVVAFLAIETVATRYRDYKGTPRLAAGRRRPARAAPRRTALVRPPADGLDARPDPCGGPRAPRGPLRRSRALGLSSGGATGRRVPRCRRDPRAPRHRHAAGHRGGA